MARVCFKDLSLPGLGLTHSPLALTVRQGKKEKVNFVEEDLALTVQTWVFFLGRWVLLLFLLGLWRSEAAGASPPKVYLVVVDGFGAKKLSSQLTPHLWELVYGEGKSALLYSQAQAVMPAVTNVNHVSLMTGAYPSAHGIIGNYYWNRSHGPSPMDQARLVEVETLFTVLEKEKGEWVSAAVFGKWKLAQLFRSSEGQIGPDHLWSPMSLDPWVVDGKVMDEVLRTVARKNPNLLFVNLPGVDLLSHIFGPDSPEAHKGILEADRQIGRLLDFLKTEGLWREVVLMLTADHAFSSLEPSKENPYPAFSFGRELARRGMQNVVAVSNGGVEYVYLETLDRSSPTLSAEEAEQLKAVRALALEQPEVEEALYRLPHPQDGGEEHCLRTVHPDWRLSHPRAGELLLVARPGYHFNDPFSPSRAGLRGGHGGPYERHIPVVISGGHLRVKARGVQKAMRVENPDLGRTAAWLLGLREPRYLRGEPVPEHLKGRILTEAFLP